MTGEFGPLGWPYAGGSSAAVSRTKGRQRGQRQAHGVGDCSVSRCVLLAQAADTMAAISVLPVRCGTSIQGLSVHRRQLAANRRHTGLLPITLIPGSQVHIILYVLSIRRFHQHMLRYVRHVSAVRNVHPDIVSGCRPRRSLSLAVSRTPGLPATPGGPLIARSVARRHAPLAPTVDRVDLGAGDTAVVKDRFDDRPESVPLGT